MTRRGSNEGTIRKRSDRRWEARFTVDGRQRSVYGRTREEASRKLRAALADVERGIPLTSDRLTVGQYLETWLESSVKASVRPGTYQSYESHVRVHLSPALGKVPLAKLQPLHVQRLLNELVASGLAPGTVLRIRATLRRALNQAMRWDLVARNVATLIDPPKAERFRVEPITEAEATALLAALEGHRLQALFMTLLGLGLRLGEALGLRWEDVHLDDGQLTVRHTLQRIEGTFKLTPPKSEASRRTLRLPTFVMAALRQHRAAQGRARLRAGEQWQDWDLVFATDHGGPLDMSNVNHAFKRVLAQAGVRPMRVHDLRHGCASFLLAQGVSARVVMETLGHSQISLTMNTYAHVMPSLKQEAADRMDALFGKGAQTGPTAR